VYTATSKLLAFDLFVRQLTKVPYVGSYPSAVGIFIISIEYATAIFLLFKYTRLTGFMFSFALLTGFTVFIALMLTGANHLPCTCGGVIEQMTWKQHLAFNIFFIMVSGAGAWLEAQDLLAIPPRLYVNGKPVQKIICKSGEA
jgi:hypothetical protein